MSLFKVHRKDPKTGMKLVNTLDLVTSDFSVLFIKMAGVV